MKKEDIELITAIFAVLVIFVTALPFIIKAFKDSFFMEFVTVVNNAVYCLYKSWLQAWRDIFGKR